MLIVQFNIDMTRSAAGEKQMFRQYVEIGLHSLSLQTLKFLLIQYIKRPTHTGRAFLSH